LWAAVGLLWFQDDGPFVTPPRALRVLQRVKDRPKAHQGRCPFVERRIVWKARHRFTQEPLTVLDSPAPEVHAAKSRQRFTARLDTHDLAPAFFGLGEPA
jgi:hypothetical protein